MSDTPDEKTTAAAPETPAATPATPEKLPASISFIDKIVKRAKAIGGGLIALLLLYWLIFVPNEMERFVASRSEEALKESLADAGATYKKVTDFEVKSTEKSGNAELHKCTLNVVVELKDGSTKKYPVSYTVKETSDAYQIIDFKYDAELVDLIFNPIQKALDDMQSEFEALRF